MSALEREASKQIQAILQFQAVLQSANRLLWPDMFQLELVQAARLLHFDLRPKLQRKATAQIADRFKYYANILVEILACWHRRNQLLVIKLGLTLDDIPITARIGQDERREIFETKAKTLPTLEGCEVNFLTALGFQSYFTACIAFKMTAKERRPSSQAEKQISDCLASIKDQVKNVTTSAEQLNNDAAAPWSRLSQIQAANVSSTTISNVAESKGALAKRRSSQTLHKVRRMFSMTSLKSDEEDQSRKNTSGNLKNRFKRMSTFVSQSSLSIDHRKPSSAPVQSSTLPGLSALPPASLLELEKKQLEIRKAFMRASDNGRRADDIIEERQDTFHATFQERPWNPRTQETKETCDSVTGIDIEDFASDNNQAWQKEDNGSSTPKPQSTNHANRRHAVNHSNTFNSSCGNELTALERDILEGCTTTSPLKPSHIADSETEKVWWRDQAFEALEGRSSHVEGQATEQSVKRVQQEAGVREEGEEFKHEQLDACKTEARALALSVLEGTGPYDTGSDLGGEGGPQFTFGAFQEGRRNGGF